MSTRLQRLEELLTRVQTNRTTLTQSSAVGRAMAGRGAYPTPVSTAESAPVHEHEIAEEASFPTQEPMRHDETNFSDVSTSVTPEAVELPPADEAHLEVVPLAEAIHDSAIPEEDFSTVGESLPSVTPIPLETVTTENDVRAFDAPPAHQGPVMTVSSQIAEKSFTIMDVLTRAHALGRKE